MAEKAKLKETKTGKYSYALGRRKTSSATVRLYETAGENTVNGKKLEEYLNSPVYRVEISKVFEVAGLKDKDFSFTSVVKGGGFNSQVDAIKLAIARAIVTSYPDKKKSLKDEGLLTRDPREVERKKTGLHKARKREQYSKR